MLSPDALDLEYTRMMMGFLLFNPRPRRIAMVGLGGGSLAKFCYRYLPWALIEVVEIDPRVIALRNSFMVPADNERFRVIEDDGARYMAHARGFDVILLDGFEAGGIPEALCSQSFYAHCHDALTAGGMVVSNFHVNHPLHDDYLGRMRASFGTSMCEVIDDDMTNSVVFACKGRLPDAEEGMSLKRPDDIAKDAWRQLMPTFRVIDATMTLR